mmetsp:Transcript_13882/g.23006  ORF Transcript_13882/g.23006 Transcript_13882/m.23006 type:complete len:202 (-) Transcript_13882:1437-2042(-)
MFLFLFILTFPVFLVRLGSSNHAISFFSFPIFLSYSLLLGLQDVNRFGYKPCIHSISVNFEHFDLGEILLQNTFNLRSLVDVWRSFGEWQLRNACKEYLAPRSHQSHEKWQVVIFNHGWVQNDQSGAIQYAVDLANDFRSQVKDVSFVQSDRHGCALVTDNVFAVWMRYHLTSIVWNVVLGEEVNTSNARTIGANNLVPVL